MNKTYSPKAGEIERHWYVVDASELPLGRLSTTVARLLTGKHKPQYAPHVDTGDFVIVINAEKAVLTGRKEEKKIYYRHSTYPGGLKEESAGQPAPAQAGQAGRAGRLGHAAEEPARASPAAQAEGLRRHRASPSGAKAHRHEGGLSAPETDS